MPDVWFPHLGIEFAHINATAFTIFGLEIAWYGIIIAMGVMCGYGIAAIIAKKTGQRPDFYLDFLLYALIVSIIGARLYYVIFSWGDYKDNLLEIFNLRSGGLAIYGGVIGAFSTAFVYSKVKKYSFLQLVDTGIVGLALGQGIGRWGNFFNQEVFGGYTDSLFAMRLNVNTAAYTTPDLMEHSVSLNGVQYIQVHPTFLYESVFCILLVVFMCFLWKHRKFRGQIFFTYFIGYGLERFIVEGMRTDQLYLWGTGIPVSQVVSIILILFGVVFMTILYRRYKKCPVVQDDVVITAEAEDAPTEENVSDPAETEETANE